MEQNREHKDIRYRNAFIRYLVLNRLPLHSIPPSDLTSWLWQRKSTACVMRVDNRRLEQFILSPDPMKNRLRRHLRNLFAVP